MLTRLTTEEFDRWVEWAYRLAKSAEHASYPSFRDGIKSKTDFIQRARRGFEDEEILLFRHGDAVCGWIQWYAIPAENYAQTVSFLVQDHVEEAAWEFAEYVAATVPGASLDIGLDGANQQAAAALEKCGFALLESSVNHALLFDRCRLHDVPDNVCLMHKTDETEFRRLHNDPDMYWNADRILANRDRWRVYLFQKEGRVAGVMCCMLDGAWPEIFSVEFENDEFQPDVYRGLMAACLRDARSDGCQHMTYFEEDERALPVLSALGFDAVGQYRAYRKELKEE